jgi:WD40 repeat protein
MVRAARQVSVRSGHTGKTLAEWPLPSGLSGEMHVPDGGGRGMVCDRSWPEGLAHWDLRDDKVRELGGFDEISLDVGFAADGRFAVAISSGVEGEFGELRLYDQDGEQRQRVEGHGPMTTVAFSPDGKHLACARAVRFPGVPASTGTLTIRDATTLAVERSTAALVHWWRYLDEHVALAYDGKALQVWDVDALVPVQSIATEWLRSLRLSGDGGTLAVTTARDVQVFRITRRR